MAGAMKKVDKIRQIVRLKQLVTKWKHMSLRRHSLRSEPDSEPCTAPRSKPPSGFVFVYVGSEDSERRRFAIPARFLNLPVFSSLLDVTEEEFGLRGNGGLVIPCHVDFFVDVVQHLRKNEHKYGKLSLEDFFNMFSEEVTSDYCKENAVVFTPLLQKTRV